ncbi:50S ribosomal protein L23 [Patescibacteria group bacterium]|nr:50S ribosomal protein L23 [Patescibacteria group bacterium]
MGILDKISKKDKATGKKTKVNAKKAPKKAKKTKANIFSSAYKVLKKPLVTEKGTFMQADGKYLFEVSKDSSKDEVAQAIKKAYGVTSVKVNIINVKGKSRRLGKTTGKTSAYKKAIVTLADGDSIQIYEGV